MLTPAVLVSTVPTPAELYGKPESPWTIDEKGRWRQDTIALSVDRTPLLLEERLIALMRSGLLSAVSRVLVEDGVGQNSEFPAPLMLLLVCASRGCRSENELCRRLQPGRDSTGLWPWLRTRWREQFAEQLGPRAPTRDDLRSFRAQVVAGRRLDQMRADFQTWSLALAQGMGSLTWKPRENLTDVDVRNLLIGDGTVTRRYSELEEVTYEDGQTGIFGSRAKHLEHAKIQRRNTDNSKDGKGNLFGLNITHIGTPTYAGYLLLALDKVDGAESTVAMNLLDEVLAELPPARVHAVVYDKAITGWHVDYLLGRYGIPAVGKATAQNSSPDKAPPPVKQAWDIGNKAGKKALAQQVKRRGVRKRQLGPTERAQIATMAMTEALAELKSLGQDPGLTVHHSSRGVPTVTHSTWATLGTASHTTRDGVCRHHLVVDDNTLTVLDEQGGKLHQPPVESARAVREAGGHTITATWLIPCPKGDFHHTDSWAPRTARRARTDAERRRDRNDRVADRRRRALSLLRLIPQVDGRWNVIAGTRNNTESWHHNYKDLLPNKRASSPDAGQQMLQYLAAALLYNAEHWERHRRHKHYRAMAAQA
jgi:hypothetical protein